MAENERLDVVKSRRWLILMRQVKAGAADDAVLPLLGRNLVKTLRAAAKQIPICECLRAHESGQEVEPLLRSHLSHDFAQLLLLVSRDTASPDPLSVRYVEAVLDRYLDQIGHRTAGECAAVPDFDAFQERADKWRRQIADHLRAIADALSAGKLGSLRAPSMSPERREEERKRLNDVSLVPELVKVKRGPSTT